MARGTRLGMLQMKDIGQTKMNIIKTKECTLHASVILQSCEEGLRQLCHACE